MARFGGLLIGFETRAWSRRHALRFGCATCAGFPSWLSGGAVFAQQAAERVDAIPERFERPAIDSDEGGLWAIMDREETRLRRSSFLITNPALKSYLQSVLHKIAASHGPDIRIYAVRNPWFNASIAPNGMMQIWSGLLLRLENEAQLVAVLAHEFSHYLNRDSLQRLQDLKSRSAAMTMMAPLGWVGLAGQLIALAGAFTYSRAHETRADQLGIELMRKHGYRTSQAAHLWEQLRGELSVGAGGDPALKSVLFATHPGIEERSRALSELSASDTGGDLGADRYLDAIDPLLPDLLADELKRSQYDETIALMSRLASAVRGRAQILAARADAYRLRGQGDDSLRAIDDYQAACQLERAPALAWRGLGLVQKSRKQNEAAAVAFTRYLAMAPSAPDAALIQSYLEELK